MQQRLRKQLKSEYSVLKEKISKAANIYTLLLMAGFPLFMTDKYYNIQDSKMYFVIFATALCFSAIMLLLISGAFRAVRKGTGNKCRNKISSTAGKSEKGCGLKALIKRYLCAADLFAIGFFIILIISTLSSNWIYEAFWGNMGRYQGLYLWIFYFAGYIMISRFYKPKHWHMDVFIAAGFLVCAWGVLDFFYMSPIGWQKQAVNYGAFDFSSTIGNVNLLTAFEGMILGIAAVMFIGEKNAIRSIFYYIAAFTAMLGIICGFSDNALISLGAVICFVPFYAFKDRKGIIRYLAILAGIAGALVLTGSLIESGIKTVSRQHWGLLLELCAEHADLTRQIFTAAAAVLIAAGILYAATNKIIKKKDAETADASEKSGKTAQCFDRKMARKLRIIWCVLGVAAVCVVIYIFYDANTGGHPDRYAPYSTYLIFNDNWGTRRGYNWNLAFRYMKEFTLQKKLFGAGPETYPIYTYTYDYYNMVNAFDEVYDSPHNEWIQYLFTTGILGVLCYYGWVISSALAGLTAGIKTSMGTACAYGIIIYTLVSFVNISAPCLTPMVILCMGICAAAGRYGTEENKK